MVNNPEPKRVAILLPSLKFGGAERVSLSLACALQDMGFEIDILLMSFEGEFLEEALLRFNVVDLSCDRTWKLPGRLLAYLRRSSADALISSFWKLNLCACAARAFRPSVRLLVWEHGMIRRSPSVQRLLFAVTASVAYRFAKHVVCVSNGVRGDIAGRTIGLKSRLVVIFNPIQPPTEAIDMHSPDTLSGSAVVWVGRMTPAKNPGLLLDALLLLDKNSGVTVTFVGDGPERAVLQQRVADLGIESRVRFEGFQLNPFQFIAASQLLVLSSDSEGFGNVLVEAMYCGLRVVSTDCGPGVHDIIQGCHGTVVPVGDAAAMAVAIRSELVSRAEKSAQVASARRFLPEKIARDFVVALT